MLDSHVLHHGIADNTEVEKDLNTLRDELKRYRNFISHISEGVWRIEHPGTCSVDWPVDEIVESIFNEGRLVECNSSMARMYGYDNPADLYGVPVSSLLVPTDPRNRKMLADFVRGGFSLQGAESAELDRHGQIRYFRNNLVGIVENGRLVGGWGTQQDITEFKDFESKLTALAQQAAKANEAKSAFIASVSHEIRTPLGVILGFADLALEQAGLTAETRNCIMAIRRNGQQLNRILGEVLDFSKIEASRMDFENIRIPLAPMVDELISFLKLSAREKGLELNWEAESRLPRYIRSDPTRVRQILNNLICNAIKFTSNGRVDLWVRAVEPPVKGEILRLEFRVSDTGIGLPDSRRAKLFEPFSQMASDHTRKYGGTGLGLTLSRQLARGLGGDLRLESSVEGEGSVFAFELAAGEFDGEWACEGVPSAVAPTSLGPPKSRPNRLQGKRVLVVEDSEDNQVLISRYLSIAGMIVDIAGNGLDGVSKARNGNYDLIVMDIQMPGLDGHGAAKQLRQSGCTVPIVALTAHAFKDERDRALANGFNDYLTKPINRGQLIKALETQGRTSSRS